MDPKNFNFDYELDHADDEDLLAELYELTKDDIPPPTLKNTQRSQSGKIKQQIPDDNFYDGHMQHDSEHEDIEADPHLMDELLEICKKDADVVTDSSMNDKEIKIEHDAIQKHVSVEENDIILNESRPTSKEGQSQAPVTIQNNSLNSQKQHPEEITESQSVSDKAKNIILRRKQKYLENAKAAKDADDKEATAQCLEVVKMFKEALQAIESGAELTEEDIAEIPGTPPPYIPHNYRNLGEELQGRMNKFKEIAQTYHETGNEGRARSNMRMMHQYEEIIQLYKKKAAISSDNLSSLPCPPGFKPLDLEKYASEIVFPTKEQQQQQPTSSISEKSRERPSEIPINMSIASDQLKLVVSRQAQLKKAALEAKHNGDLEKAKELLTQAKSMDKMIIAAKGGLPVDIKSLPMTPTQSEPVHFLGGSRTENALNLDDLSVKLGNELKKQIDFSRKMLTMFQGRGDAKSVLFYEALLNRTQNDFKTLQDAILAQSKTPRYQMYEIKLPVLDSNPDIPEDVLEMKISLKNVKLPEGWSPSDCALFVSYNFPFPRDHHQTGQTPLLKGTNSPEFPPIRLNINRSSAQLLRICKRSPLKFEIFNRGDMLIFRSDKMLGRVDIPLSKLEESTLISESFDILEGRRKTPGKFHIEMRINKPLGEGKGTGIMTRKWLQLSDNCRGV